MSPSSPRCQVVSGQQKNRPDTVSAEATTGYAPKLACVRCQVSRACAWVCGRARMRVCAHVRESYRINDLTPDTEEKKKENPMNMSKNGVRSLASTDLTPPDTEQTTYIAHCPLGGAPVLGLFPPIYADTWTEPGRTWRRLTAERRQSLRQSYAHALSQWRAGTLPRQRLAGWLALAADLQRLGGPHA
jgi:hypothetical protein